MQGVASGNLYLGTMRESHRFSAIRLEVYCGRRLIAGLTVQHLLQHVVILVCCILIMIVACNSHRPRQAGLVKTSIGSAKHCGCRQSRDMATGCRRWHAALRCIKPFFMCSIPGGYGMHPMCAAVVDRGLYCFGVCLRSRGRQPVFRLEKDLVEFGLGGAGLRFPVVAPGHFRRE